mgnify:CR=1 FL=1
MRKRKTVNIYGFDKGMICPKCSGRLFDTVYTRPKTGFIMRKKECRSCKTRVTSHEKLEE